jgi:hypothetical protein
MVKTEGLQTKEVITNNGQWPLGYITNYFKNFHSQGPKDVSKKNKYYSFGLIACIIHRSTHYWKNSLM